MKQLTLCLVIILVFCGTDSYAQTVSPQVREELVQQMIRDGDITDACVREQSGALRAIEVSLLYLNQDRQPEYLVNGLGSCCAGTGDCAASIYQRTANGYRRILAGAPNGEIEVLRSYTNGYRDIRTTLTMGRETFSSMLRFDGVQYRQNYSGQAVTPRGNEIVKDTSLISDISNSNLVEGCGCLFRRASASRNERSYVFMSSQTGTLENNRAFINIDGRDTMLRFVSTTYRPRQNRRGSMFTETYRSGDVTARVTYVVTSPNRPGGEVTKYSATITVTKGNRSQTVRASGECGC